MCALDCNSDAADTQSAACVDHLTGQRTSGQPVDDLGLNMSAAVLSVKLVLIFGMTMGKFE